MLGKLNGKWVYNDSRENPLTNFYGMYGGGAGHVGEKVAAAACRAGKPRKG